MKLPSTTFIPLCWTQLTAFFNDIETDPKLKRFRLAQSEFGARSIAAPPDTHFTLVLAVSVQYGELEE